MALIHIHELHLHVTVDDNKSVLEQLSLITQKIEQLMSKATDIKGIVDEIKSSADNIAADLDRIAGNIEGGLTKEEADVVVADLGTLRDQLKAIADRNPETPPAEPV